MCHNATSMEVGLPAACGFVSAAKFIYERRNYLDHPFLFTQALSHAITLLSFSGC